MAKLTTISQILAFFRNHDAVRVYRRDGAYQVWRVEDGEPVYCAAVYGAAELREWAARW